MLWEGLDNGHLGTRRGLAVYDAVWAMIASGRNAPAGTWQGNGMTSSSAQFNTYTSLGVMLNSSFSLFSGESVDSNCILVKYTWYGDTDLSGFITGDDYFRTDMGYFGGISGWSNGDYDYNGVIDGSDYYLLDLGYLGQTGPL